MLLKSTNNIFQNISEFVQSSNTLMIFSAYIKLEPLKALIENNTVKVSYVCVRWEPRDLIFGASDIEIYPYLKSKGITLYINSRLHAKVFLDNYSRCLLGSCNISKRGLNFPISNTFNFELAVIVDYLKPEDRLYFDSIIFCSTLVTESIYDSIKSTVEKAPQTIIDSEEFKFDKPDKDFLISALPLSYSIEIFFETYRDFDKADIIDQNCLIHDLALYNIPLGLSEFDLYYQIRIEFFNHIFIKTFLQFLDVQNQLYFGSVKAWIYDNCTDVPLPRKWELTENIQILYRWLVTLGEGKYNVDRPNYSERLYVVSK